MNNVCMTVGRHSVSIALSVCLFAWYHCFTLALLYNYNSHWSGCLALLHIYEPGRCELTEDWANQSFPSHCNFFDYYSNMQVWYHSNSSSTTICLDFSQLPLLNRPLMRAVWTSLLHPVFERFRDYSVDSFVCLVRWADMLSPFTSEHLHLILMRPGGDFAYLVFKTCNLNLWTKNM